MASPAARTGSELHVTHVGTVLSRVLTQTEDTLRDYVEGREPVPTSPPAYLVEVLGLTPQEENELAWTLDFGRVRDASLVITSCRDW